mgnify:CR=1 FL=1
MRVIKAQAPNAPPTPLTHRRVLKIALPIVLSNATVPILGAVDVGVVGQMGEAAPIGAVAMGAIILSTIFWIFGFLRMGTVGLVGQAAGAGDDDEVSAWLTRAMLVAVAGGAVLIAVQVPIFWAAFQLSPASQEVENLARAYLSIRIWTAPAAIAVYALTGWLVAMERTGGVFWVQLAMNGLNIALSFVFVLGFGWGVEGVAYATVIAELAGAGLGIYLCRAALDRPAWRDWVRVFDRVKLVRMALLNTDILLRSAMLMVIFSSFVFIGARFGDVTLAANEVLIQFMYITAVQIEARAYLWWMVAAPIVGCAAWMFDGIFIGAARGRDMRNMMAISFVIYWVSIVVLLPLMGNHGLWAALLVSFAARGATLAVRYPALERGAA